jgi:hypothetical protein
MKSSREEIIGTSMDGGFYAGRVKIGEQVFALIVAPKFDGEHDNIAWIDDYKAVPGAQSYSDGFANTEAMAEAGSNLAKWARGLRIAGHDDWYLPSQDELEIIYRNLKPTSNENYCHVRSGINLSAVQPTRPYTSDIPAQTNAEAFQSGGEQSFYGSWYWSSTQHAADSDYTWAQLFSIGYQDCYYASSKFRARAVRRLPV